MTTPLKLLLAQHKPLTGLITTILLGITLLGLAWGIFAQGRLWLTIFFTIMVLCLAYLGHLILRTLSTEREQVRELQEANRNLENKVVEGVQALSSANQEIQERQQQLEKAYQDLTRIQKQLIQTEKMASLGLLVAGVAHELNNPISFVHSNLEFIDEYTTKLANIIQAYGDSDKPMNEYRRRGDEQKHSVRFDETLGTLQELITSCKEGAGRVKKIVLDLRTFSRNDDVGLTATDLHEGIESTLNLLAKQYKDRITIHRDYANLPWIECFPGQINQVFMNILQNAAQAIPFKGDVWITTSLGSDDQVTVTIRDNGVGISEEQLARVFDPFFTTKPVGTGTGLGLSISHDIIKRHGGTMRVASQLNKGTEFTIELPIHPIRNVS